MEENKNTIKVDHLDSSFEFRNEWEPFNRQYGNDFRILGNIFDNPELLNELKGKLSSKLT